MRYPNFATALRQIGTVKEIQSTLGVKRRQVFEYLAGRNLPRAEIILPHQSLVVAAQQDIREHPPTISSAS